MAEQKRYKVRVGESVHFLQGDRLLQGVVARLAGGIAFVLGDDRCSYRVPLEQVNPPKAPSPLPPGSAEEIKRAQASSPYTLNPGQRVAFTCRGQSLSGAIVRLNPRRAHVLCDDDREYAVPYFLLEPLGSGADDHSEKRPAAIEALAYALLTEHGLIGWTFGFDHAVRRAGCCNFRRKRISMALQFARRADEAEIRDTLLHEIAHALVGKKHNHDEVWRAKALQIGCSGERCHDLCFTPPRYIVACRNGCWRATAERRRRNVVCRECRGEIVYQTYTDQRWQQLQGDQTRS